MGCGHKALYFSGLGSCSVNDTISKGFMYIYFSLHIVQYEFLENLSRTREHETDTSKEIYNIQRFFQERN